MRALQTCSSHGCTKRPTYGVKGSRKRELCKNHALPGMINVDVARCCFEGCDSRATFSFPGATSLGTDSRTGSARESEATGKKKQEFCVTHSLPGMILSRGKGCAHGMCFKRASYGFASTRNREFCALHAKPGMVNINRVKMPGTTTANEGRKGTDNGLDDDPNITYTINTRGSRSGGSAGRIEVNSGKNTGADHLAAASNNESTITGTRIEQRETRVRCGHYGAVVVDPASNGLLLCDHGRQANLSGKAHNDSHGRSYLSDGEPSYPACNRRMKWGGCRYLSGSVENPAQTGTLVNSKADTIATRVHGRGVNIVGFPPTTTLSLERCELMPVRDINNMGLDTLNDHRDDSSTAETQAFWSPQTKERSEEIVSKTNQRCGQTPPSLHQSFSRMCTSIPPSPPDGVSTVMPEKLGGSTTTCYEYHTETGCRQLTERAPSPRTPPERARVSSLETANSVDALEPRLAAAETFAELQHRRMMRPWPSNAAPLLQTHSGWMKWEWKPFTV